MDDRMVIGSVLGDPGAMPQTHYGKMTGTQTLDLPKTRGLLLPLSYLDPSIPDTAIVYNIYYRISPLLGSTPSAESQQDP